MRPHRNEYILIGGSEASRLRFKFLRVQYWTMQRINFYNRGQSLRPDWTGIGLLLILEAGSRSKFECRSGVLYARFIYDRAPSESGSMTY